LTPSDAQRLLRAADLRVKLDQSAATKASIARKNKGAVDSVLFARVGRMKLYKGQQADDEKPVGGGEYNKNELGHELFNFVRIGGRVLGYFQPQTQPPARRKLNPSTVNLERVEADFTGDKLKNV
jgi:hypothetical protein